MADRLTDIEDNIALVLKNIDGTLQSTGYTYKTKTGTVNIYDEMISMAENLDNKMVNYEIEQDFGEDALDYSEGQNAMTNEVIYKITCKVHNIGDEVNPKRAIIIKMNEVLADLKFAFGNNHTVNKKCNWFIYAGSEREFAANNNIINAGNLIVKFTCNYSQALYNTDVHACY